MAWVSTGWPMSGANLRWMARVMSSLGALMETRRTGPGATRSFEARAARYCCHWTSETA